MQWSQHQHMKRAKKENIRLDILDSVRIETVSQAMRAKDDALCP